MKRITALIVLIMVSHVPASFALSRVEPKIPCEVKGSDCAPAKTSFYSISDPSSGRTLEVTHVWGRAGHTATVSYVDPAVGNTSFTVDRTGAIQWADGTEFSSDLTSAAWVGQPAGSQGTFSAVYYADGERRTVTQSYDLANITEESKRSLMAVPDQLQDDHKESLRAFWQEASAALDSPEALASSNFRLTGDVVEHGSSGGRIQMMDRDSDHYDHCVQCAFSVITTGLAGAGVISACALTLGLACVGALFAYFASGYSFASGCAKCFADGSPDKGGGVSHK